MMVATRPLDVLLVEDDPGDELITREAFEQGAVTSTLHVARDGQDGLDFLYRRGAHRDAPRPDLILLDLNLPKYDGRQLLQTVGLTPTWRTSPFVVLYHLVSPGGHPAAPNFMPTPTSPNPLTWNNSWTPCDRSKSSSFKSSAYLATERTAQ